MFASGERHILSVTGGYVSHAQKAGVIKKHMANTGYRLIAYNCANLKITYRFGEFGR